MHVLLCELRAELRRVSLLVAVAALLCEECRANDHAVGTRLVLHEVRSVGCLREVGAVANAAERRLRDAERRLRDADLLLGLQLRAELRRVSRLVAVATLLCEECRADDHAVGAGLVLHEVRSVCGLGESGILADLAEGVGGHIGLFVYL